MNDIHRPGGWIVDLRGKNEIYKVDHGGTMVDIRANQWLTAKYMYCSFAKQPHNMGGNGISDLTLTVCLQEQTDCLISLHENCNKCNKKNQNELTDR